MPDAAKLLEAELDADGEEQEDDPDLRHVVDQHVVRDQAERTGAYDDAGDQIANDRHEADTVAQISDQHAYHEKADYLTEIRHVG